MKLTETFRLRCSFFRRFLTKLSVENKYFMLRFVCYRSRDLSEHVIRPHVNKIDSVNECSEETYFNC